MTRLARLFMPSWLVLALVLALAVAAPPAGRAAGTAAAEGGDAADDSTAGRLATVRQQLNTAQDALRHSGSLSDAQLQATGKTALAAQAQAVAIADRLAPDLSAVDARMAELGTPASGVAELADMASQRRQLAQQRLTLDAQARLARLLAVEADQLAARVWSVRRAEFQARLGERTNSILAAPFWNELVADLPHSARGLAGLQAALAASARATPTLVWLLLAPALAAGLWLILWAQRRALGWLTSRSPAGRLRRSIHALLVLAQRTFSTGLVALALYAATDWTGSLPPPAAALLAGGAGILWFGGFIDGLGTALICATRPSWRLPALPDAVALHMRWFPLALAVVTVLGWLAEHLVVLVDASLALAVAVNCVVALAIALTMTLSLMRAERTWRLDLARDGARARPVSSKVLAALNWLVLVVAVASLLTGFVAFGSFAVKQLVWVTVVVASAYLLVVLIDDSLMAWLAETAVPAAPAAPASSPAPSPAPKSSSQMAVLLSAALRLVVAAFALTLLLAPFGDGPGDLLIRRANWPQRLTVGEFNIEPVAIVQALLVLALGLAAVRLLRLWLIERYLPSTGMDANMRSSATALFGYAGVVLTVALATSALGIGLERIAWVASALSVGIGFGLQAVVQNFVSGLIMLAERPVKVGDWVSLSGVEGDIRRINVRATEIQMDDRSTLIVPNSEFITKVVRNRTLTNPLGLVVLKLPLPLDTDAQQVRELLLRTMAGNDALLDAPPPSVLLDGVENGTLLFSATGYVESPRHVGRARSALLFDALAQLKEAGIKLSLPQRLSITQETAGAGTGTGTAAGTEAGTGAGA